MTDNQAKLQSKIEAFRSKKEVIKAQYSAAEAQVRISEAANGVGEEMADVGLAMQRALDKTENMRARAQAVDELEQAGAFEDLTQLGGGEDDIDRQLSELSSGTQVDGELEKMKAELGLRRRRAPASWAAARRRRAGSPHDRAHRDRGAVPPRRRGGRHASTRSTTRPSRPSRRATRPRFRSCSTQIIALMRAEGEPLPDDELHGSDVIVPPPDTSFEEARHEFTGDGLIPD